MCGFELCPDRLQAIQTENLDNKQAAAHIIASIGSHLKPDGCFGKRVPLGVFMRFVTFLLFALVAPLPLFSQAALGPVDATDRLPMN
jgi:hypothetical protein